jgi:hypothetical protein
MQEGIRKAVLGGMLGACLGFVVAGCLPVETVAVDTGNGHGPPPHAPAHGYRAKYGYRYYPGALVYFDVDRKLYFYMQNGDWKVGVSLPDSLRVKLGDSVTIEMDSDKPYTEFAAHKAKYPPGQIKNEHSKSKKWKSLIRERSITAHLLRWRLVDIPGVSSTSSPPCICAVLERSLIKVKVSGHVTRVNWPDHLGLAIEQPASTADHPPAHTAIIERLVA